MPDQIREICFGEFPRTLQNMHRPPDKLYIRGRLTDSPEQRYLCVVGTRKATPYGHDAVNALISGLRGYPISIVSGLAYGIDSIAHIAALEAGLHCIAFPGSSLAWDEIYPSEHLGLAEKIVHEGGALISEWEPAYPTGKWAFPARNTLMAGLSDATLVAEAGYRSGSLMTAKHALEFDREVLAIPGPIKSAFSYGPHMLIRTGAALVSSPEDILEALGFAISRRKAGGNDASSRWRSMQLDLLSAMVMDMLSREEMTVDRLAQKTRAPLHELNAKVSLLELKGLLKIKDGVARMA